MTISNDIWGYVAVAVFALLAHESWRWCGALLGRRVSETDDVFVWVRYVSSALVAALAMRFVFFPVGVLANIAFPIRASAMAVAVVVFIIMKRNLALGIIAGSVTLIALSALGERL